LPVPQDFFYEVFLVLDSIFLDSEFLPYFDSFASLLPLYWCNYYSTFFIFPIAQFYAHVIISKIFLNMEYSGKIPSDNVLKCCIWYSTNLNFLYRLQLGIQVSHFLLGEPSEKKKLLFSKELQHQDTLTSALSTINFLSSYTLHIFQMIRNFSQFSLIWSETVSEICNSKGRVPFLPEHMESCIYYSFFHIH
jgi:hypothetical protein